MKNEKMNNDEGRPEEDRPRRKYDLAERTAVFGEAIIDFALKIERNPVTTPLISQLVRAGTSIGANYCEADDAVSKKEFLLKIGTCQKESRETQFWLRMLARASVPTKAPARPLYREAGELRRIFSASRRTGLKNMAKRSPS